MSLEALPNEVLLKIFKDLYPPGAFDPWTLDGLGVRIAYPPKSFMPRGWKKPKGPALAKSAGYKKWNRARHYLKAILTGDLAMQGLASMNHRLHELSKDRLILRAKGKWASPEQDKKIWVGPQQIPSAEMNWGTLVRAMSCSDELLSCTLARMLIRESEERSRHARNIEQSRSRLWAIRSNGKGLRSKSSVRPGS